MALLEIFRLLTIDVVKSIDRIPIQDKYWVPNNERCEMHCWGLSTV